MNARYLTTTQQKRREKDNLEIMKSKMHSDKMLSNYIITFNYVHTNNNYTYMKYLLITFEEREIKKIFVK